MMIVEGFFGGIFTAIYGLLSLFPMMDVAIPSGAVDAFIGVLDMSAYFLPVGTIVVMLGVLVMEELAKIVLSLIKLVLKFIPFVG